MNIATNTAPSAAVSRRIDGTPRPVTAAPVYLHPAAAAALGTDVDALWSTLTGWDPVGATRDLRLAAEQPLSAVTYAASCASSIRHGRRLTGVAAHQPLERAASFVEIVALAVRGAATIADCAWAAAELAVALAIMASTPHHDRLVATWLEIAAEMADAAAALDGDLVAFGPVR